MSSWMQLVIIRLLVSPSDFLSKTKPGILIDASSFPKNDAQFDFEFHDTAFFFSYCDMVVLMFV